MQPEPQNEKTEPQAEESALQHPAEREPAANGHESQTGQAGKSPRSRQTRLHRKAVLLPEITQLALEGHTGRAIALRFNLSTRTVNRWLGEIRGEWLAAATKSSGDLMAVALARLNGVYCEAMVAWRKTQTESEPTARGKSQAAGGNGAATKKGPRRRRQGRPSDALLARAISAVRESIRFLLDSARTPAAWAGAAAAPQPAQQRSTDSLERMSYEELRALEASLKAQRALSGTSAGAASAGIAPNCPAKPEQDETAPE
jgi:hypothetical protein